MKISETHREILPIKDESDKEYCRAFIDRIEPRERVEQLLNNHNEY